ncbi:hypothetical protein Sjap_005482 [Stephania japonica]|uniref:RNase H type-1 domain-containing protein n=1 Tax=Stephania japonica TaxID=461633 RepID=A0AAP0K5R4_9MAGN
MASEDDIFRLLHKCSLNEEEDEVMITDEHNGDLVAQCHKRILERIATMQSFHKGGLKEALTKAWKGKMEEVHFLELSKKSISNKVRVRKCDDQCAGVWRLYSENMLVNALGKKTNQHRAQLAPKDSEVSMKSPGEGSKRKVDRGGTSSAVSWSSESMAMVVAGTGAEFQSITSSIPVTITKAPYVVPGGAFMVVTLMDSLWRHAYDVVIISKTKNQERVLEGVSRKLGYEYLLVVNPTGAGTRGQNWRLFGVYISTAKQEREGDYLGFEGPRFTWTNRRLGDQRIAARLDRGVVEQRWLDAFPNAIIIHLCLPRSDHLTLMLDTKEADCKAWQEHPRGEMHHWGRKLGRKEFGGSWKEFGGSWSLDTIKLAGALAVGVTSSIEVMEGWVIRCALQHCREYRHIMRVYSDALIVTTAINEKKGEFGDLDPIIRDVRYLVKN